MKKLIPILFVVAAITACQKEPSLSKLDDDYVVFTDYDKSASFVDYLTYYMPDSVLLITDSEKATYWTNDEANYILETFAENMAARGFMLVDTKEEADLGLQVSYIEDVHYFVNYPSPNWWWGYPGYWDPFYWGYGGYWGYSFPVYYSYDTNSLLTEIIDLTASDKSEDAEVPVLWNSFITGVSTGYAAFDIRRTVTGINQSFEQSPDFKAAQQ